MSILETKYLLQGRSTPELLQFMQNPPPDMPGGQTAAFFILQERKKEAANALMMPDNGQSMAANMPKDIQNLVQGIQQLGAQPPQQPMQQSMQPQQGQPQPPVAQGQPPQAPPQAPMQQGQPPAPPQAFAEGGAVGLEQIARKVINQRQMADRKTRGTFPTQQANPALGQLKKPKEGFAGGGLVSFSKGDQVPDPYTTAIQNADLTPYINTAADAASYVNPINYGARKVSELMGGLGTKIAGLRWIRDPVTGELKRASDVYPEEAPNVTPMVAKVPEYKGKASPGDMLESQVADWEPAPASVLPGAAVAQAAKRSGGPGIPSAAPRAGGVASSAFDENTIARMMGKIDYGTAPKELTAQQAMDRQDELDKRSGLADKQKAYAAMQDKFAAMSEDEKSRALQSRDETRNMGLLSMAAKMLDAPRVAGIGGGLMGVGQGVQEGLPMIIKGNKDYNDAMRNAKKDQLAAELAFKKGDVDIAEKKSARAQQSIENAQKELVDWQKGKTTAQAAAIGHGIGSLGTIEAHNISGRAAVEAARLKAQSDNGYRDAMIDQRAQDTQWRHEDRQTQMAQAQFKTLVGEYASQLKNQMPGLSETDAERRAVRAALEMMPPQQRALLGYNDQFMGQMGGMSLPQGVSVKRVK